jgi:DNA invertase Pin-like site-specific DNA recombinase
MGGQLFCSSTKKTTVFWVVSFGLFAALAEFERELIVERIQAALAVLAAAQKR